MDGFDDFRQRVQEALTRLYDPTYWPSEPLWVAMGCHPQQGPESIQAALIRTIEDLKPGPEIPTNAPVRRVYDLLLYRYIQRLTQEEAAQRLGISPRHLRREQRDAVHALARRLWEQSPLSLPPLEYRSPGSEGGPLEAEVRPIGAPEWLSQVRKELASLQESAPGAVADVGETIASILDLGRALSARHDLTLAAGRVPPGLMAVIHPSALRQILIAAVGNLVHTMPSGRITLAAGREGDQIVITIAGRPVAESQPPESALMREILTSQAGSLEICIDGDEVSYAVRLTSVNRVSVLVADDNADLVHFYRRYTDRTRYRIMHVAQGKQVFQTLEAVAPDIIVLDVMLPDVDGWELLARLRQDSRTRATPIIVCSVIKERELALTLGATLYLPKPVRRSQFIQALDHALCQAPTVGPKAQASSAEAP